MQRLCYECSEVVGNPYHSMTIFVWDKQSNRIAYSDMGMRLCEAEINKVLLDLQDNPGGLDSVVGFAIEGITGAVKSVGSMQFSLAERHRDYRYLDKTKALQKLPKTTEGLIRAPCGFQEYNEGNAEWTEASWAIDICFRELSI